jgi:hypothetical protein
VEIIILLFISICIGWLAHKLKKNFFIWFLISIPLTPLAGLILLLVYHFLTKNSPKIFIENINEIYSLYKNDIISLKDFENKKEEIILSLKKEQNPNNFLYHLIDLKNSKILNENDLQLIKRKLENG